MSWHISCGGKSILTSECCFSASNWELLVVVENYSCLGVVIRSWNIGDVSLGYGTGSDCLHVYFGESFVEFKRLRVKRSQNSLLDHVPF
jgi:hypothetical protein